MWSPENILKGRMGEALINELLSNSGNAVYRFGYETILQNLTQSDSEFDRKSETGQQIICTPDFVVVNQHRKPFFVEVKFRSSLQHHLDELIGDLNKIQKFWRAKVIVITPQEPCFRIANPPYTDGRGNLLFCNLEDDPDLNVSGEKLRKFSLLVQKYFDKQANWNALSK
jgi:hypothetical protein